MTPSSAPARTVLVLGANGRFGLAAAQAFAVAADMGEDAPAGGGERLCRGKAEAAVGAEDEDGAGG